MSEKEKNMLNESAVLKKEIGTCVLDNLVSFDAQNPYRDIAMMLCDQNLYVKFVQPEYENGKTTFKTFNVNSQLNLQDNMSKCEIIVEPDQDSETKASELGEDLEKIRANMEENASAEQAKSLPVKVLLKQESNDVCDVCFAYTKNPKLNVLFAFAKQHFVASTPEQFEEALEFVANFLHENGETTQWTLATDAGFLKLFEKHTSAAEAVKAIGKTGNDLLADSAYDSFVVFSSGLYVASQLATLPKATLDKYWSEVEEIKALAKKPDEAPEKKDEAPPAEKTEPAEKPAGPELDPEEMGVGDPEIDPTVQNEKPAGPKTLNIVQDQSFSPNSYSNAHQMLVALAGKGVGCIVSPYPLESLKMEISGLPDEAKNAITSYTGGKDLIYVKADGGKPVMSQTDPTTIDKAKLYNQVAHQLDGWYVFAPVDGKAFTKMLFLFKKKHDKAIFELQSFKPEIPLHIAKLSGNKWIPEFCTEQNTLKKQGCRTLLWSTNDSKFGNASPTHAASAAGQTGAQPVAKKPQIAQSDVQKRKYVSELILLRLEDMLSYIYKHTMKIHGPVLDKSGNVLVACNGGQHELTDKEWQKMADNFDNIKEFSPFGPVYNALVKKLAACFDVSSINTSQFDVQEPLPEEQEKAVKQFGDSFAKEFADLGLDGIRFQIVAPGRKPKYDVNTSILQGSGWQLQDGYTLTVMVPGVDTAKFYGAQAVEMLENLGVGKEVQVILDKMNKDQAEKIGLALVMDNGFPS